MITVIVYRDEIAIIIEIKLVHIPQTRGKHFEVTAIGFRTDNNSLAIEWPPFPITIHRVETYITNTPIDPSVRSHSQTRYPVPSKTDMNQIGRASCRERCENQIH